jgi:hypothetical protein
LAAKNKVIFGGLIWQPKSYFRQKKPLKIIFYYFLLQKTPKIINFNPKIDFIIFGSFLPAKIINFNKKINKLFLVQLAISLRIKSILPPPSLTQVQVTPKLKFGSLYT